MEACNGLPGNIFFKKKVKSATLQTHSQKEILQTSSCVSKEELLAEREDAGFFGVLKADDGCDSIPPN